jgi:hypothetical protein
MTTLRYSLPLALLTVLPVAAVSFKPDLRVTPPEAVVRVLLVRPKSGGGLLTNVVMENLARADPKKSLSVTRGEKLLLEATAPDHATQSFTYDEERCLSLSSGGGLSTRIVRFELELDRIRQEFPVRLVSLPGATFKVDGSTVSAETSLVFNKQGGSWSSVSIQAEAPGYEAVSQTFDYEGMKVRNQAGGRPVVDLDLSQKNLTALIRLKVDGNVPELEIIGEPLSEPLQKQPDGSVNLSFSLKRERADSEWSKVRIKASKPGYEWAPAGEPVQPFYDREFARADLERLGGGLTLRGFQPMKFVLTPLLTYHVDNRAAALATTNSWATVTDAEPGAAPLRLVRPTKTARLLLSSLSAPKLGGRIYFAMANYEFNQASEAMLKGSTIYFSEKGGLPTPLTSKPEYQDTDPAVSPNGKLVVFSSFVGGTRCIRQVESKGGIAFPVSEDPRFIDTEPAITDRARIVFTRRTLNAPPGTPPQITVQAVDENGQPQAKLFGPVCDGHSPAWNPDGNRLAFIDAEGRLCLVSLEDGRVRPLLDGAIHASPSWDSLGKTIYFAAQKEQNERGQRHFDLFRLAVAEDGSAAGTPQPLTSNTSLDYAPVLAEERSEVYFLSNRGATRYGDEESLAVFSLKLQ